MATSINVRITAFIILTAMFILSIDAIFAMTIFLLIDNLLSTAGVKFIAIIEMFSAFVLLLSKISSTRYQTKIFVMYLNSITTFVALLLLFVIVKFEFDIVENVIYIYLLSFAISIYIMISIFRITKTYKLFKAIDAEVLRFYNSMLNGSNWYYFVDHEDSDYSSWATSKSVNKHKASTFMYRGFKEILVIECNDTDEFKKLLRIQILQMFYDIVNHSRKLDVASLSKITANNENHKLTSNDIFTNTKNK